MPKARTFYTCDLCFIEHPSLKEAAECEKKHYVPVAITAHKYGTKKEEFPDSITVNLKTADGKEKTIRYYRHGNS